jgi:MFS family permease
MPVVIRRFVVLLTRSGVGSSAWWSVVARLPVYLMTLAIVLVVRERGGSYVWAGLVSALYTVGIAIVGPVIARWADRAGRRPVLLTTGLVFPLAVAGLVWLGRPGDVTQLVFALLAGAVLPPANSCIRSVWARLPLSPELRQTAYLWEALLTEVLLISAPVMLAVLMLTGSASRALSAVVVLGGVGAWGLAFSRTPESPGGASSSGTRNAAPAVLWNPSFRTLTGIMVAAEVPIGLTGIAIPAFVEQHGTPSHTGFIYACWGIGSALGAMLLGKASSATAAHRRFPRFLLAFAVGIGIPVLAWSDPALAVALAVGGTPLALISAGEMSLVSELADQRLLTEAFTWASTATVIGEAVGQQLGGILVESVGPRGVFLVALGFAAAVTLVAFACRGRLAPSCCGPAPART